MGYNANQTFGGYGSDPSSTFSGGTFNSEKPFGGYEVDKDLPNIWDFPEALKPGEKESPANPANRGKNFLDTFVKTLGDMDKNKYRTQAQQGGIQSGGSGKSSASENVGKLTDNLSVYTPPSYSPFTVQGVQGSPGFGGAIGTLVGTAASFIPGIGPGIAAALPAIGGSVGGMFG
jgi:hypothetical protein